MYCCSTFLFGVSAIGRTVTSHLLRQISFGEFYQKTMNFHAGETAKIIMGNMFFPREDC